jgi:hypothetical protein
MLIPVYLVGFILGGLVFFAIAQRVTNRRAKISLKLIGVLAGPVFFAAMILFSGWERKKTYEMEWLIGAPAAEYLRGDATAVKSDMEILHGFDTRSKALVVLRRNIGERHPCYNSFDSEPLAQYLESLPTHTVSVRYRVVYDFYLPRGPGMIEQVGDFGRDNPSYKELFRGMVGFGEIAWSKDRPSCFSWIE